MAALLFCVCGMSWAWEEKEETFSYKWLIEPKYERAFAYSEGLWPVKKDGLWGYVDSADRVVVDFQYFGADPFRNGMAYVEVSENVWGLIDPKGRPVIAPQKGTRLVRDPLLGSKKDIRVSFRDAQGRYGFLDLSGKIRIPAVYSYASPFEGNWTDVKSGDCWGVIDRNGKSVIPIREKYRFLACFNDYVAFETTEGLMGVMDRKERVIVPPQYKSILPDNDGLLKVETVEGKVGFMDATLRFVVEPRYAKDRYAKGSPVLLTPFYGGGLVFVEEDGMTKALDEKGEVAFEFPWILAEPLTGDEGGYVLRSRVTRRENGLPYYFLVDKRGRWLLPPEFSGLTPSSHGIVAAAPEGLWGLLLLDEKTR
ncbi:WG repeat-containing protein [Fretibacterium sp. OH1220_COT-178]|uniref:WG repeat-containing protein n=1 Tax=Fretibacterium sp. OH1220_COT-178 TaxID=2491047 RepID=UPI001F1B55CD|nr:WG repeat-containing protein [Fretibacterium sp. OH1220_COT-178]